MINNGKQFVAVVAPDGRTPRPERPAVPTGPEIRIAMETDKNRLRTYPSLMQTPYDSQLLEWHATGQIAIIDVATGAVTKFGKPDDDHGCGHVTGRQVRACDPHEEAVLLHRAREQLRPGRRRCGTARAKRSTS